MNEPWCILCHSQTFNKIFGILKLDFWVYLPKICGICGCEILDMDTGPPVAEIIYNCYNNNDYGKLFLKRLYHGVNGTIWKLGKNSTSSHGSQRSAWYKWLTWPAAGQSEHRVITVLIKMLVLLLIPLALAVTPDNIRIIQQQSAIVADSALTQTMNRCMLK